MNSSYHWFFLALPDSGATRRIGELFTSRGEVIARHESGRPWIVGAQPAHHVALHERGPRRLALIGTNAADADRLSSMADGARTVRDFADVSGTVAGSYCVLGSAFGQLYAQGTATGVRRLFHARIDGADIVADRADVLADLGGLPLDDTAVALRLTRSPPFPLQEKVPWRGVVAVPFQDYVVVDGATGRECRTGTWWRRPEATLSRAEGADRLREALGQAVDARTTGVDRVACDLSGGLDSTPVCYFAAQGDTRILASTLYHDDPGGLEDLTWARVALPVMPGVDEHVARSTDTLPEMFGGLREMTTRLDEPGEGQLAGSRIDEITRHSGDAGIRMHLNGIGGDHLLCGMLAWEHTLFRSRPFLAWRRARALHIPAGLGPLATWRALRHDVPYSQWLGAQLAGALDGKPATAPRIGDWSFPFGMPEWLTDESRAAIVDCFRSIPPDIRPLGRDRAENLELLNVREGARIARAAVQLGAANGVSYESPLLDDRVVEAVLSVRREERSTPVEWKPLIKDAMSGLLPEQFLTRTTKVNVGAQAIRGYAKHHQTVYRLCEESGIVDSGLVDLDVLRTATRPDPISMPKPLVGETVGVAMFVRSQKTDAGSDALQSIG